MRNYHTLDDHQALQLRHAAQAAERLLTLNIPRVVCKHCQERLETSGGDIVQRTVSFALNVTAEAYIGLDQHLADIEADKQPTEEEKRAQLLEEMYALQDKLEKIKAEIRQIDDNHDPMKRLLAGIRKELDEKNGRSTETMEG